MSNISLASQECYNVTQDRKGYIWFGTERGLYRYANGNLTVFDHRNGLPEESVYAVAEDQTGRLWFATSENRILYFDGKRLKEPPFSRDFQKMATSKGVFSIPFFMESDQKGNLYVSNCGFFFAAKINTRTNRVERISHSLSGTDFMFEKVGSARMMPFQWSPPDPKRPLTITLLYPGRKKIVRVPELKRTPLYIGRTSTCHSNGIDFFSVENHLFQVKPDGTVQRTDLPAHILSLYPDGKGGIWVGMLKKGVMYFPDVQTMKAEHHSLDGYSVTGSLRDSENGIWCTTLERGVFYCRNYALTGYQAIPGLNKKSTLLKPYQNSVFVSSEADRLFNIDKQGISEYQLPGGSRTVHCEFIDIVPSGNHWLIGGTMGLLEVDEHFRDTGKKFYDWRDRKRDATAYQIAIINNRKFLARVDQISEMIGNETIVRVLTASKNRSIQMLNDNTLLVGGKLGLFRFDTKTYSMTQVRSVKGDVIKTMTDHSGRIWVLTRNDGIYWLDKKLSAVKCPLKLPTQIFFDISEDYSGVVWIGCNRGLLRLSPKSAGYQVQLYNQLHGLPSNEVYKVATTNDHCYFSTFEGLFRFPVDLQLVNTVAPPIYLGVKSSRPITISFEIAPPFWRTWTFILVIGFVVTCLALLLVRVAIRSNKRKEVAKTAINKLLAEYQMSALQSQMNPHFIFNAINTIQGYILKKSEKEAYDYLAKFSKLIRMVLHHSQEKQLLLFYDLEVLNLYLELEQLRFGNNFDYVIRLDEQIDPRVVCIPGMLLQPYVENAVWHGIMNLRNRRRGLITIDIRQLDDTLKITIDDNGVGRALADTFRKDQHHRSVGMALTERRIQALNQLEGYDTAKVEIIDLFDAKGEPSGTRVELILPII